MENQNIRFEVCGTTEFREGKLDGYATVRPVGKFLSSSPLILTVCTNCGESLLDEGEKGAYISRLNLKQR